MGDRINFPTSPSQTPAPPMVYVHDKSAWEYKLLTCNAAQPATEDEMNALGKDGWELAGVLGHGDMANFYFKRMKG